MFQQAKVSGYEYLPERDQRSAARTVHSATRSASLPEVQSVSMDVSPGDVYRCRDDLVTREIVGETIIVPIGSELAELQKVYSLNATGAFVWERLDGSTPLKNIHEAVTQGFKVRKKDAWTDLAELVGELAQAGLIERVE
jgi:hypothetical protein